MSKNSVKAQVEQISPLTDSVLQLILRPKQYTHYVAGQYLKIILGDESFSYSIANAPLGSHKYELHIRHSRDNAYHQALFSEIKRDGVVRIDVPFGTCELTKLHPKKPILFIAAGTGFAPIKAMIEQLLADGDSRVIELYWGARSKSDLYMDDMVLQWQSHVSNFRYFTQISEINKDTLASMILERHIEDLSLWQIVLSGPFDLVYSLRDALLAHGVERNNLFSDAFDFEGDKG